MCQWTLSRSLPAVVAFVGALAVASASDAATITRLDFQATAVSGDGRVVFGHRGDGSLMRWTADEGSTVLGQFDRSFHVWGASDDGSVAAGEVIQGPTLGQAFRWTAQSGVQIVKTDAHGYGLSGDGRTVVGFGGGGGFSWRDGTTVSHTFSPRTVSRDGGVIAGFGGDAAVREVSGVRQSLRIPGSTLTVARAITPDGDTVVGSYSGGVFLWEGDAVTTFPSEALGYAWIPFDVSADGRTAVGRAFSLFDPDGATILHDGRQQRLSDYLATMGLEADGLGTAWGISDDGNVIVGYGPTGYVVYVPEPGALLAVGAMSLVPLRTWRPRLPARR